MKRFDSDAFYERLYSFARRCQELIKKLPRTTFNLEYSSQLIRSSGSIGANYIEAIEALSKKDFVYRLRICRKESRESVHWLRLIKDSNDHINEIVNESRSLIQEGQEIKMILTSSILTSEKNSR